MPVTRPHLRRGKNGGAAAAKNEASDYDNLSRDDLVQLLTQRDKEEEGGLRLMYTGQTPPWHIVRRVRPRRQKIEKKLSVGSEEDQSSSIIMEGENLQAMVSLYKYRGQVDLILTDPPYNTGGDFRYNDKWDEDPNDPDLGKIVPADDGSRHCKWLKLMTPRVWMMKEMLKPGGVLAICIDQREMFRLGMILDQVFGEENRIAIINWQKTTPKNQATHVSNITEYVLVYAKDLNQAKSGLLERKESTNRRFNNPDNDPLGPWQWGDLTGKDYQKSASYHVQSPFTGKLYDPGRRHWANKKTQMKKWLEEWGIKYEEVETDADRPAALVVKGWSPKNSDKQNDKVIAASRKKALTILERGQWPILYWGQDGNGGPAKKHRLEAVKAGLVPSTFWLEPDDHPLQLDSVSWPYEQSGRSRDGLEELDEIVGKGHGFDTVKPLKLFTKIIQIWCPDDGIVLDPFAGSGTTAHALLELNAKNEVNRRFVLIEQGRPENGDNFASTLTRVRVARAISGERVNDAGKVVKTADPLPGGFRYIKLLDKIDGDAVLALEREEMIDLLLTSHWDQAERSGCHLQRLPAGKHQYLIAIGGRGEGYFLVWNGPEKAAVLDRSAFKAIVEEAKAADIKQPYHVYARISAYAGPNIEFYQIPQRILEKLGFNEATEPLSSSEGET
jgi:adenine-specific DNA-methyltransferase